VKIFGFVGNGDAFYSASCIHKLGKMPHGRRFYRRKLLSLCYIIFPEGKPSDGIPVN